MHREFLRAGADVVRALTFYASEKKLATVGSATRSMRSTRPPYELDTL
jgi:methionine synthase I (cobalamin-dependent)